MDRPLIDDDQAVAPPGYIRLKPAPGNAFQPHVFDAWGKLDEGSPVIGFRVAPIHCGSGDRCHGGMLMTFCDFFLPNIARLLHEEDDSFTPTISIDVNFLKPARLGQWIEGRARILRRTTNLLFVQGIASHGGTPLIEASGIFKRGKSDGRTAGSKDLLARLGEAQPIDRDI